MPTKPSSMDQALSEALLASALPDKTNTKLPQAAMTAIGLLLAISTTKLTLSRFYGMFLPFSSSSGAFSGPRELCKVGRALPQF